MNNTDRTFSPKGISTAERLWVVPETASPPAFWKGQSDKVCILFLGYDKDPQKQSCSDLIVLVLFFMGKAASGDMYTAIRL